MEEKAYVFVVCGAAEHLDTLRVSYDLLRKKTKLPVYVVTDNRRNEYSIAYEATLDIATPAEMNHHQASIWLKTSLHKLLPAGKTYVYLDTDILAIGEQTDKIFDEFIPPIRFAPDHCRMPQFSSYSVNCGCLDVLSAARNKVNEVLLQSDPLRAKADPQVTALQAELSAEIEKQKKRSGPGFYLRYFLSWPVYTAGNFRLDRRKKIWSTKSGIPVMRQVGMRTLARKADLRWKMLSNQLALPDGRNIYKDECDHLAVRIREKFGITVTDKNWQHWNGGVFVFSDASQEFMDTWHAWTMEIFSDPQWKTRDQGTLIATAWNYGLQNHPPLDKKWNLIADYYNPQLNINERNEITLDGKTWIQPELLHVYHHFGDTDWAFWNKIAAQLHDTMDK
jgi:hypothetical protein